MVIDARPQFIKAATALRAIRTAAEGKITQVLVNTGPHCDHNVLKAFPKKLDIRSSDFALVYGDINAILARPLTAVKFHIPVGHVEAGLPSFNMSMLEEINRLGSDRLTVLLLCPTETAVGNLTNEVILLGGQNSGDVMYDAAVYSGAQAKDKSSVLVDLGFGGTRLCSGNVSA
jgi:UDP-GlcNAc3NAcA epimerase